MEGKRENPNWTNARGCKRSPEFEDTFCIYIYLDYVLLIAGGNAFKYGVETSSEVRREVFGLNGQLIFQFRFESRDMH